MPPAPGWTRRAGRIGSGTDQGERDEASLTLYLAAPRGFCAGVDRAIKIVEMALEEMGAPVYVRHGSCTTNSSSTGCATRARSSSSWTRCPPTGR